MRGVPKAKKKSPGRPSTFTQVVADAVCDRLALGESLRAIVQDPGMPGQRTVYRWLEENESFRQQYVRAREEQAHAIAELAVEEATNARDAQLGRLAYDARRWFAGKLAPKVYGEKVQQEHSGPEGQPLPVMVYIPANGRDEGT